MSHSRFADRLEQIDNSGWLCRIDTPVDPADPFQVIEDATVGMEVVLLSNITNRRFPMAGQVMVSEERISYAIALEEVRYLTDHLKKLVRQATTENVSLSEATSLSDSNGSTSPLSSLLVPPVIVKQPPCQQVVRLANDLDSTILPSLRLSGELAISGRDSSHRDSCTLQADKITAATLFTLDPDSGRQLAAGVDFDVESPTQLVPCWKPQDSLGAIRTRYVELGHPMPVAIHFGGDPLIRVVAEAPKPYPIDPAILCASLWSRAMEVTPCRTLPGLAISADADLVIEGLWRSESSSVDGMITIEAITHRINPIIPFALSGERSFLRRTLLQGMVPWWRAELPGLVDLIIPSWEDDGTVLVGSVEKAYASKAQQIADALLKYPTWSDVRLVILLDETVKLRHESEVLAALVRHTTFDRKTLIAVE